MTKRFVIIWLILISIIYLQNAGGQSWDDLLNTADSLSNMQNQDSAIVVGKLALAKTEETFGIEDTSVARVLHQLGRYSFFLADYSNAETFWKRALAIRERLCGSEHQDVAATLNSLAALYTSQGKYVEAEPLCKQSLTIREKTLGLDHPDVARSLNNLAVLYWYQGKYSEAEPLYKRSLAIYEDILGLDHPDVARCLSNLGNIYLYEGKYTQAELFHQRSLAIREKILGPDHRDVASSLNSLGDIYQDQGKYAQAEPLYRRSLAIREKALGLDHPGVAASLNNLGNIYRDQGKYTQAESLYRRSLAIREEVLGLDHPDVAISLISLANLHYYQGKYIQAESLYTRSLTIYKKAYGSNHPGVATCLNNLGIIYLYQDDYVQAESFHKQALAIREKTLGLEHPNVATSLSNLGMICAYQSRYTQAESYYKRSLSIREKVLGSEHPQVATSLEFISELYHLQNNHWEAVALSKQACSIRRKNFADNGIVLSEKDALSYSQSLRKSVGNYLTCYSDLKDADNAIVEGAADIIFSSKGQVSDVMFERQKALVVETDSITLALAESLRLTKFRLSRFFVRGPGENVENYREVVDSLSKLANELEADLSRRSASFRKRRDRGNISASRIESLLPEKSVLVEYLKYNYYYQLEPDSATPRYLAVVLANDEKPVIISLGDASEIDSLVDLYRKHMLRVSAFGKLLNEDQVDYEKISSELYDRVWLPIEDYVADKDFVLIAPDGALNMISFAGLMDVNGRYLIELFTIHYLTCGRDLIRLQDETKLAKGLFALGDPDFDAIPHARLSELPISADSVKDLPHYTTRILRSGCQELTKTLLSPLPATRSEIEQVVANWQKSTDESAKMYLGLDASEENFKAEAPGNRVIHIATHGYFLGGKCMPYLPTKGLDSDIGYVGENPLLLSGLFFAGANLHGQGADSAGADDGVLTAYEVSAMNLAGTDLVVLSACETGLGKVEQGEGIYGLYRAFQMVGASTVISTLWPVSDKTTAKIMGKVYQLKSKTLPEQLRMLQLEQIQALRNQGRPDHPVNWAAFVAVGDWE